MPSCAGAAGAGGLGLSTSWGLSGRAGDAEGDGLLVAVFLLPSCAGAAGVCPTSAALLLLLLLADKGEGLVSLPDALPFCAGPNGVAADGLGLSLKAG